MKLAKSVGPRLFTIGHSDHGLPEFRRTLLSHSIDVVVDVRSHPYSRLHQQFNRESLVNGLATAGIRYLYLGGELGARRREPEAYQQRKARYELISRLPAFQEGLERLRREAAASVIALLCAEHDPIICHRMILVCRELRSDPIEILHLLRDGTLEPMAAAEDRLRESVGLPSADLFRSRDELTETAYSLQAERIAFTSEADVRTEREVAW